MFPIYFLNLLKFLYTNYILDPPYSESVDQVPGIVQLSGRPGALLPGVPGRLLRNDLSVFHSHQN